MLRLVIVILFWTTLWFVSPLKFFLAAFTLLNTIRYITSHITT